MVEPLPRWENLAWAHYDGGSFARAARHLNRAGYIELSVLEYIAGGYLLTFANVERFVRRDALDALDVACLLIELYPEGKP